MQVGATVEHMEETPQAPLDVSVELAQLKQKLKAS
jgi:hypothetical protein